MTDGGFDGSGLDLLIFLLEVDVGGEPEAEEECVENGVFFDAELEFDALEGLLAYSSHSVGLTLKFLIII